MVKHFSSIRGFSSLLASTALLSACTTAHAQGTPVLQTSSWPEFHLNNTHTALTGAYGATGVRGTSVKEDGPIFSSPIIANGTSPHADGVVYSVDEHGNLFAVDELNATVKWTLALNEPIFSTPTVAADGSVFLGGTDGNLYRIDGDTGFILSEVKVDNGSPIESGIVIDTTGLTYLTVEDGLIQLGPTLVATSLGPGGPLSTPAIGSNGFAYVGTSDGHLTACSKTNGTFEFSFATNGAVVSSPAIGSDGTVYFGSYDGNVYAINGTTGASKWSFATLGPVESSPAIGPDGTIYIGSDDGNVYALNPANGSEKWEFVTGDSVFSSPAVGSDSTVYVGSNDGTVYAINGTTGAGVWSVGTNGPVVSSPAIGPDGSIWFGSYDGTLYSVKGQQIKNVFLAASLYTGAVSTRGVVQLASPAGPGGATIVLRTSTEDMTVQPTVVVPAGATGVSFPVTISAPSLAETESLFAIFGSAINNGGATLHPYPISNLYASPSTVTGGQTTHGVVQISGPAGKSGNVISLVASNTLTVPSTVTIPPGKTGVSFTIKTTTTTVQENAEITADYPSTGGGMTTNITITP